MAKELNETANVTETINGNLVVRREAIIGKDGKQLVTKDGSLFFGYFVRGFIRGKEKKVDFAGKDKGGYEPLDVLFSISEKAELVITEEENTDFNGVKTRRTVYTAQVADSDGEIWKCEIKPQRNSDKALLDFLLIEIRKAAAKQSA